MGFSDDVSDMGEDIALADMEAEEMWLLGKYSLDNEEDF